VAGGHRAQTWVKETGQSPGNLIRKMKTIVVQVQRTRKLNDEVIEYELIGSEGDLPTYSAGAHIEVHIPGIGPRHYSMVRPWGPSLPYVIAVKRENAGRGGSVWIHQNLEVGATFEIGFPRNNFALDAARVRTVLIAGGIGITPILGMAEELAREDRPFDLVVCARDMERLPYAEEVSALAARGQASIVLSDAGSGPPFQFPAFFPDLSAPAHVYCCGPVSLMEHVKQSVQHLNGVVLHQEQFGGVPVSGSPEADIPFRVRCARAGIVIDVSAGQSMLDALLDAGIDVDHSCREGYCGTCLTRHIDGSPIHLDTCLSPADRTQYVAVCVSRALRESEIVLDI